MAMLQIVFDKCITQLVRWQSDREWDEAVKIEKARGGMHRYWAQRAQPWDYLHGTPPSIDSLPRLLRLIAIEAQAYLQRRFEGRTDFTWRDVQMTYCDTKDDGFRNTLIHRHRIMRHMFGATDPDLRNLNDQGKIWYDELTRMIGSDNREKINILVKKGGKSDIRDFGVHRRSGGYSAPDWRGKGPASGGYPAQSPPVPRSGQEAEGKSKGHGTDKGKDAWKARRTDYTWKAPSWGEASQWSQPAASSSSWQWSDDRWYYY